MAPQSKSKNSILEINRPGQSCWRTDGINSPSLIINIVKEATTLPCPRELRQAAMVTLLIVKTIQTVKENKEGYERLGDDSAGLIAAIWRSYKKAEAPEEWLSAEMREILEDLTHTLENICSFVEERLSKKRTIRMIFSRADDAKVTEYRELLNYAVQKFELQSHMNINDVLIQLVKKNDQLSEHLLSRSEEEDVKRALEITAREARDREEAQKIHEAELKAVQEILLLERMKQVEVDHQARDDRWHSDELRKIEKETQNRQSELERLRTTASAMDIANRLKKAQQEEIAQLKRKIAAEEASGRSATNHEEEEWEGDVIIEEATSEEEEEVRHVNKSSKAKRNPSKSPKRRFASRSSSDSTDEDEDVQTTRSSKTKTAGRKPSRTSRRVEETEGESTDEEEFYIPPPPRKSPKVNGKPRSLSGSPPHHLVDFMTKFDGLIPLKSNSRPGSPVYLSTCQPASSSISSFGFHTGVPGTMVNSGVGNITNTNISNIGNNKSKRIYRK
ncbi:hypothetical protein BYT27DRAFT_7333566 [Phlegmacium glaucopus]|nr:hypothetical protein BYT27DRAFT_7333566 [Phlegmacium glaucopus]